MAEEVAMTNGVEENQAAADNFYDLDQGGNETKLKQKIASLETEKKSLADENDEIKFQVEKLKAEFESMKSEESNLKLRVAELEREVEQSEETQRALESIAGRAVELETNVSRLQHDLISAMSDGDEANKEVAELKREVSEKEVRIEEVDSLPPTARIGIILYGRTVSVYDFSEESMASADVLPGEKSPIQESLKALIYGTGVYLSPMHASKEVAHKIFSSLRPYKLNIAEASRDRCLGTAVEVALAIIQGPSAEMSRGVVKRAGGNSRIIVCAGGPNTYGPGSVPHSLSHPNYPHLEKTALKWMENLGREAHRNNTVVDILCAGTCPVRVPILQPLAKASGGVLVLHDDFGEAFGVNLQRASSRASGSHGLLEIRCSDDILITQVVGPGEEAHADTHETFKNDNALCIQMLSVEETQSFALSMETKGDIKSDCVFFQFAVQYTNVYQADISRVVTVRLPTVDSVSAYLESVQDEVAAILIAKRTLLRAKKHLDAMDMRGTIDERIKDIALKFGSLVPKSKLHRFPKELSALPELLFHLRRGPLLGSIVGHEDERSVLRNLFLNASFDLSLRMVAPRCLMHREGGTFEELPAYDLAMQSDTAVVLDHGTDVFIWLGAELAADEGRSAAALAACRTLAEEITELRFPAPRILAFKEGSSQARYFVSRLIPAHKDPPYEQEARFPQLRSLTTEQRTKLKSSFIHFDDPSFCEWMRSLKAVPPEPS